MYPESLVSVMLLVELRDVSVIAVPLNYCILLEPSETLIKPHTVCGILEV